MTKTRRKLKGQRWLRTVRQRSVETSFLVAAAALGFSMNRATANPDGLTITQGDVTASFNGANLDLTVSHNAILTWQHFNIAAGDTTTFHQPGAMSVVWNQILDQNPSQIWGNIRANGIVVLMNQNGFFFGPNSSVLVGGFVVTTSPVMPGVSPAGGFWQYGGPPPAASIVNYGEIRTHSGGSLFMIAEKIDNHGLLSTPDGTLGLYAGKEVLLSERPDGRGLSASVALPDGAINNTGQLIADAGTIALHARVVNQNGLVQANSVREHHGVIELFASEAVNLGANSVVRANGDASGLSDAGSITIKSAQNFSDAATSLIEARGGVNGGNGGAVEISALQLGEVNSQIDGAAQAGWQGGSLLFDPYDLLLSGNAGSGLNVNQAFLGFAQIHLQATHDISLDAGTTWDLNASTGVSTLGSLLTLEAGNNILFGNNASIRAGAGWSVNLKAGVDFNSPALSIIPGVGGIYLNGGPANSSGSRPNYNGAIESTSGNIALAAGHELLVGSGYIRTVGGGNISIVTGDGDVDAGTKNDTFDYTRFGYAVTTRGLGGIGTAAGGSVNINAGRDILAFTANIGAFGSGAGNVSLAATRDIKGRFMLINGTGNIVAGRDVGGASTTASFGLAAGGWNLSALRDIYLNEVYNPNGSLNPNRVIYGDRIAYQFDYAPDAFVNLAAGNSVQLLGNNIARTTGNTDRQPIYAPQLDIVAGAGGIILGNNLTLFPSALGGLSINTAPGGGLRSRVGGFYQLVMSDSGSPDYKTFVSGHASTPLHLGGTGPGVALDIGGDIQNLFLRVPEAANIHVRGSTLNFSFEGQNLSPTDVTRLHVDGDVNNRSDHTAITLADGANLEVLTDPILGANPALAARITYNSTTRRLDIQGIVTAADLAFLLHPQVYVLNPITGLYVTDDAGIRVTVPSATPFTTDAAALQQLYASSQDIPTSPLARNGLQIGGPGFFDFSAHKLDLGITSGIRSVGPLLNPALAAAVSINGASLLVNLAGDLVMTSSQIASFNGGDIVVLSAGHIDVGSQESFTSDNTPKGIYTGHGGSVSVRASGDININGSRIASYDGGNVSVVSDNGNVDAGGGAKGFFSVTTSRLNPITGLLENRTDRFFGSGIMAVTPADGAAQVGNITVTAGGNILANSGGVLQLPFNSADQSAAQVTLTAGGNIQANQSGVLGRNVSLQAGGNIEGLVIAARDVSIAAVQNANVTALAGGSANVSAGQSVSGSVVGAGNVNVSGSEVSAAVISTGGSANTSGEASGAAVGAFNNVSATAAQKTTDDTEKTVAAQTGTQSEDEEQKKKRGAGSPELARRVGRVTVLLPKT